MIEAGQTEQGDLILWQQHLWSVAATGEYGDIAIVRTDSGGCLTVEHLGEHEDVEDAGVRLADLRGELADLRAHREPRRMTDQGLLFRIGQVRAEIEWLEGQGVKAAVIL